MRTETKLKIERFFKEQIWQLLLVIAFLFICAFIFGKYIESIMFCVAHTIIRNAFNKQFHSGKTAICLSFTLAIGWIGISTMLPTVVSVLSSLPICFAIAFLGFIAQDRLDIIILNTKLQSDIDKLFAKVGEYENKDLYKMSETDLRQFGANKGLSEIKQDILVHRVIDHLRISEICVYRNYGRTTIKYHLGEIKRKLNINTV